MKKHILWSCLLLTLFSFSGFRTFSQGANTQTGAMLVPISLPFTASGSTTSATNEYDNLGYTYDDGPDWYYYYCPTSSATIWVSIAFTPGGLSNPVMPSISIITSGGTLVGQTQVFGDVSGSYGIPFTPTVGQCYYFIIDNDGIAGPSGFNYVINISNTVPTHPVTPLQPACSNIGFDAGTTSGWLGSWGHSMQTGVAPQPTPTYTPLFFNTTGGHHVITTPGVDLQAPIQTVCPLIAGNTNSLMLGDGPNAAYGGASIEQRFQVTASNALFTYYYALVIQDGGASGATAHTDQEQPYFRIEALDCSGVPFACGNLLVTGGPGIPGFTQIGTSGTYYKDWTPVMLDLTPYIGTCVTMRFTSGDCSIGAHYAYAYLDASCAPMAITTPPTICQYQTSTLTAPLGAASYSWVNTASPGTVLGTSNTLSITPTTTGTFTYQCTMTSVTGCNSTLTTTITVLPSPQITVTNPPTICTPATVDLTSPSVVTVTSGSGTLGYFSDAACTVPIAAPNAVATSGTYYIRILNSNGCADIEPVTVVINQSPSINVTTPDQSICPGGSVNLNATLSPPGVNNPVTFTNLTDYAIPDGSVTPAASPIAVSGITPQTAGVLPIVSVNVNIVHTYDEDITIWLQCPNGSTIELSSDNGGTGDNYTNTTFVPTGSPSITTGTAPFTGTYTPEDPFSLLNSCSVNGTWVLQVYDLATGDVGTLQDWSITFNNYVPVTYAWSPTTNMTNSTTLTPTVSPTVTTTYTVTATNPVGGCTASDPVTITINPPPTIGGVFTVCAGATTQLTGSGTPATTNPWVSSNTAVATISNTGLVTGLTPGNSTITYTTSDGCFTTQVVTITSGATISGNLTVCVGGTTQLSGTGTPASTNPWTSSNTAVATVSNTGLVTSIAAGTTDITYTNSSGCFGTVTVTVNPLPTATISGSSTICEGSATSFTISGTPNSTVTYSDGTSNLNVTLNAAGTASVNTGVLNTTTTYTLVSIQSASSTSCNNTLSGSITINLNPIPVMDPLANTQACPGDNVAISSFTATPSGATFAWSNSNTSIGLGANGTGDLPAFTATNPGTTPISGTVTVVPTLNGCPGSSVSFTITVSNNPTANAGADLNLCLNATTGNQIGSIPVTGNSYSWSPATGLSNPAISNPTVDASVAAGTLYTVTVTNAAGCTATDVVSVTINPLPQVSFSSNAVDGCAPVSVTFTNTSPTPSVNCVWSFEGGGTQTGCGPITQQYNSGGVFDVTLTITDANGCVNSITNPDMLTVYPTVHASFGVDVIEQSILNPVFHFTNNSTNATNYVWSFGDGTVSSAVNPTHHYEETPGVYHVILYASNPNGCNDSAVVVVSVIDELIFYVPNTFTPDGDEHNNVFFPVFSSGFDGQNYTLLIFDRWGEVLFESHDVNYGWDGTYIGRLCKEGVYTWKIVVKERNKDKHHEYVGHVNLLK